MPRCRPGQWQTYDIVYTAPRFDAEGKLLSPARLTVFQNGVLIQNNVELTGPTDWLDRAPYQAHPKKQPISLQDHGNPVRFRNIWVRELGKPGKKEFTFPRSLLEKLYRQIRASDPLPRGGPTRRRSRRNDSAVLAESPTKFFAKTDRRADRVSRRRRGQTGPPDLVGRRRGEQSQAEPVDTCTNIFGLGLPLSYPWCNHERHEQSGIRRGTVEIRLYHLTMQSSDQT